VQEEAKEVSPQHKVAVEDAAILAAEQTAGHEEEVEHLREELEVVQVDDH
jgi:hypothetical protein